MRNVFAGKKLFWIILVVFALVTAVAYWQVNENDFIMFDDPTYITENVHVRTGITLENLRWAFTTTHAYNWHPLTWISHMLDCQLFGLNAGRHHLMNVLLHILNTVLLFLILNRMTRALWQSAFVAALFALHPLHVESVAWAAERKDVLSTLFWMLTMGAYVFYVERPDTKKYLLALSFFALGLLAKPMLVTLPFVLLLLDWWPLRRLNSLQAPQRLSVELNPGDSRKQKRKSRKDHPGQTPQTKKTVPAPYSWSMIRPLLWEKAPFFLLSALSSILTVHAQQQIVKPLDLYPFPVRVANALVSYVSYLIKMFYPVHLAVFYPHSVDQIAFWQAGGAALLLALVTVAGIRIVRRPYFTVGWLWYLGTLIPVIGLVQVGLQSMADRYTYVPLIGIFIIVAWGVPDLLQNLSHQKKAMAAAGGSVLILLSVFTYSQVSYWKNDLTLFQHACEVTSNNYWAHYNLGLSLVQRGDLDGAFNHFKETIRIKPNEPDPFNNIGIILAKRGDLKGAVANFSEAIRLNPNYQNARVNLGFALSRLSKAGEVIPFSNKPAGSRDPESYYQMGIARAGKGNIEEAISYFSETLRIKPDHFRAHNDMGVALAQMGRLEEAIPHFQEAVRIKPDFKAARDNLQTALAQKRKVRNPTR